MILPHRCLRTRQEAGRRCPPTASREHPPGGAGVGAQAAGGGRSHTKDTGPALGVAGRWGHGRRPVPWAPRRGFLFPPTARDRGFGGCPGLPAPECKGWASWERGGAPTRGPLVPTRSSRSKEGTPRQGRLSRLCSSSPREAFPSEAVFQVWSTSCQCREVPWVMQLKELHVILFPRTLLSIDFLFL